MARSPPGKLQSLQRPRALAAVEMEIARALHVRARCTAWIATLRTQRHDTGRMEVLLRLGMMTEVCGRPHGETVRHMGDGRWWDEEQQTGAVGAASPLTCPGRRCAGPDNQGRASGSESRL